MGDPGYTATKRVPAMVRGRGRSALSTMAHRGIRALSRPSAYHNRRASAQLWL